MHVLQSLESLKGLTHNHICLTSQLLILQTKLLFVSQKLIDIHAIQFLFLRGDGDLK